MGSTAANTKSTTTTVTTTTNNNNVVQNINKPTTTTIGADAVGLANALGNALAINFHELAAEQAAFSQQASLGLQTLAAGVVARGNGGQLETAGAQSLSDAAQISKPLLIGAAILAAAFLFSKG